VIAIAILTLLLASSAMAQSIDVSKAIDLTHTFDRNTIYWPTSDGFQWEKSQWGQSQGGYWYTSANYAANEHGGTHLDSPLHFHQGGASTEQIPISRLIAPAVVIDISSKCAGNPDYLLSAADIQAWEKQHGRVPDRSILLIRTGWSKFWPNQKQYLGTDKKGDVANLHFPGISAEAARFLAAQRKIYGVGIDTASIDHGPSKDFQAHRILYAAGVYGLENVAALEKLPAKGATLIALPMKIGGGTGGPVRIVALLP
jgi:kynurenine formamidase